MADLELLFRRQFSEGSRQGRVIKQGIVAKTADAAGLIEDDAGNFSPKSRPQTALLGEGKDTNEDRSAIGDGGELFEQQPVVVSVGSALTREACRSYSGLSVQSGHDQTGIVSKNEPRAKRAVMKRFLGCVFLEARSRFCERG